ncbi:response regulator transcription factor [Nocardia sp. 2]|uniref:Response regulator transcription factor n=1 Tax=Nocardia acididurans TaxID=2802282 RepID=A0ABS1MFL9_9NOCA|nr:response regulator transcription factor [Nocardia acididurans]MBL1079379.1 response regulator transcription factor [Nocardia acididurans]
MIRVVVVDDQELVRTGLRALAERDGDITVVAEADNGANGVAVVRHWLPDVVLMDIRMPGTDGIEATRRIVADPALAGTRVAVLTTFDEDENILGAIRAGASGYLLKDLSPEQLRTAIRTVAHGDALLAPTVTRTLLDRVARESGRTRPELIAGLTPRERDVLARIGLGETNTEIGAGLHISPATARTYVSRLLATLQARDRAQLVVLAYESGLVRPGR